MQQNCCSFQKEGKAEYWRMIKCCFNVNMIINTLNVESNETSKNSENYTEILHEYMHDCETPLYQYITSVSLTIQLFHSKCKPV